MKQARIIALAALMTAGISAPALADYARLGSVDVGYRTDTDTAWTRFGGGMEGLRLTADRNDVFCRDISVNYERGGRESVFSGRLREDRPVDVDLRGGTRRVRSIDFTCRSDGFRGAKINITADLGRYRDEWRRSPDWDRLWAGIFGLDTRSGPWGDRDHRRDGRWDDRRDDWVTLSTETFTGRRDSESAFTGWRARSVDRIGLRPLDNDARCRYVRATFADGRTRDLDTGGNLNRGRVTVIDLPGRDRNITRLDLSCRAIGGRNVSIEILARR